VILPIRPSAVKKFRYLHRGTGAIAFRLPKPAALRSFIKKTGPIVAPSANFEGEPPARNLKEAKGYFGDRVAFYIDAGRLVSKPSTLISIVNEKVVVLRQGATKVR
jgi:L-threonylcarbamoyladenylate synthase